MTILNLTQHASSTEQVEAGVVDMSINDRTKLVELLNFNELPAKSFVRERAQKILELAVEHGATRAMIGGAPFLMPPLDALLTEHGIEPVYAFSLRESVEETQSDGSTRKIAVFRHKGFVEG